ncbi:MAG: RNA polymerase sigma factor [Chitinophagaceae bacterium]|nr:RNA polymerase sigma factor [Chitinophagaceae bacterium]
MEILETITHEELVEKCKKGDPSGYTGLYHRHSKEVYNTIYRLVNHTAEAEDLLQESFIAAFQNIDRFEFTGGFRAWIKRIAINKSITWMRKRKLRLVELDPGTTRIEDEDPIDEKAFVYRVEEVQRAIEALPDSYRTVVQLYLFENIPQTEIAAMLGIAHNAVRTQYHRAKQKILQTLKDSSSHEQ